MIQVMVINQCACLQFPKTALFGFECVDREKASITYTGLKVRPKRLVAEPTQNCLFLAQTQNFGRIVTYPKQHFTSYSYNILRNITEENIDFFKKRILRFFDKDFFLETIPDEAQIVGYTESRGADPNSLIYTIKFSITGMAMESFSIGFNRIRHRALVMYMPRRKIFSAVGYLRSVESFQISMNLVGTQTKSTCTPKIQNAIEQQTQKIKKKIFGYTHIKQCYGSYLKSRT